MKKEVALPLLKLAGESEINYHIYRYILSVKDEINSFLSREINPYLARGVSVSVEEDSGKIPCITVEVEGVKGSVDVIKSTQKITYLPVVLAFTNCEESVLKEFLGVFQGKENYKGDEEEFLYSLTEFFLRKEEENGDNEEVSKESDNKNKQRLEDAEKFKRKIAEVSIREFFKGEPRNRVFKELWSFPSLWKKIGNLVSASYLRKIKNPFELKEGDPKDIVYAALFLNSNGDKEVKEEVKAYEIIAKKIYSEDYTARYIVTAEGAFVAGNGGLEETLPDKFFALVKPLSLKDSIKIKVAPRETRETAVRKDNKETKRHRIVL